MATYKDWMLSLRLVEVPEDARVRTSAEDMFRGSCDFLLAHELLGAHRAQTVHAQKPLQSWVVCAGLALELALKARIAVDGDRTPEALWDLLRKLSHDYVKLFEALSPSARADIASGLVVEGTQATVESLREMLGDFKRDNPFVAWRYLHEVLDKGGASFLPSAIVTVTRGVQDSVQRAHPEFLRWVDNDL